MIFINRNCETIPINGKISFNQFMEEGFQGFEADIDDFRLHANLYFPEVRLRNFIEIRNHDCVGNDLQYSNLAIYKSILYSHSAIEEIEDLLKPFDYPDYSELRYNVPKTAMETRIGKYAVKDIAKEILYISEKSLIGQSNYEEKYLDAIKEYTLQGICPADVIIRNWNGIWNKDVRKLIQFVS